MKNNGANDFDDLVQEAEEDGFYTELDDDRRAELDELVDVRVTGVELYEDSLGDEDGEEIAAGEREFFDCDLFLENNLALELYVTLAYPDPEGEAVTGLDAIYEVVGRLADENLALLEYDQADEEGGLVLAFGRGEQTELVLVANAWMVSEWEPEEEEDWDEEKG
jgi:hypothetical protein